MKYINRDVYQGVWAWNQRQGKGIMTYIDGGIEEGHWKDDIFLRKWSFIIIFMN